MESPFYGPRILAHALPLDGELNFYFILKNDLFIKKNDLELPLIFVLFLKGKQNKKENSNCVSLFWKKVVYEISDRVRGSSYLSGRYDKDRSIPLSP